MAMPDWYEKALAEGRILSEGKTRGEAEAQALRADGPARPKGPHPVRVSEKEFTRQLIRFAQMHGWATAHFRPARVTRDGKETYETPVAGDGKGWPDLVLFRGARQVAAELKVPPNTTSSEQDEWLDRFRAAGVPAYVWTPDDWPTIEEVLK